MISAWTPYLGAVRDSTEDSDDYAIDSKRSVAFFLMVEHGCYLMIRFWNDYPFYDSNFPLLFKIPSVRKAWTAASQDGVTNIKVAKPLEHFLW